MSLLVSGNNNSLIYEEEEDKNYKDNENGDDNGVGSAKPRRLTMRNWDHDQG